MEDYDRVAGRELDKCLLTDNCLEFFSEDINVIYGSKGIVRHHIAVRSPQKNGVVERMNRTIMETFCCMFSNAKLTKSF